MKQRRLRVPYLMLVAVILLTTAACGSATVGVNPDAGGPAPAGDSDVTPLHYGTPTASNGPMPLLAGQVDDNTTFGDYLAYMRQYQGPAVQPIPVDSRVFIRVVDGTQHAVAGARVQIFAGNRNGPVFDGQTMSDGRVLFLPQAAGAGRTEQFHAVISRGGEQAVAAVRLGAPEQTVALAGLADNTGPVSVDLVFLLDATGSMGDELDKLKGTIGGIATRIAQLPDSSPPRFGLVAYRDAGEAYVTRAWDFTDNVGQFQANLANVTAEAGGDNPEAVNAGLNDAIHLPGWTDNTDGRHLRLIVLVGDAPPHLDYGDTPAYPTLLQDAVRAGIKICPIGASGLDPQAEYIFRQFAQVTQGQFVFLTYANGDSGDPGTGTAQHVSGFTVQDLDSLIVGLVAGEMANQTGTRVLPRDTTGDAALAAPPRPASITDRLMQAGAILLAVFIGMWLLLLALWRRAAARTARRGGQGRVSDPWATGYPPAAASDGSQAARFAFAAAPPPPSATNVAATNQPTAPLPVFPIPE
jgi:hypothetical protein